MDVALPNELMAGVEQFKEFYEVSNSNRKLNWYYTLGTCTVKAQFERTYEFVLSTMQAALLTLFNDDDGTACEDGVWQHVHRPLRVGAVMLVLLVRSRWSG